MKFITNKMPRLVLGLPLDFTLKINGSFSAFQCKLRALSKGKLLLDKSKSEAPLDHSDLGIEFMICCCCCYPTPSEGWGHGGRPWSPRSRATFRVWTRGRTETESRQRVSGAKSP